MIVTFAGLITNHARVLICGDARARGIGARKIELAVCGIAFTRARRETHTRGHSTIARREQAKNAAGQMFYA